MRESVEIIYILQSEAKEVLVTAQDIHIYTYIYIYMIEVKMMYHRYKFLIYIFFDRDFFLVPALGRYMYKFLIIIFY